ncbi:MAG: hypothetical protein CL912_07150 [Deltaproteobacteria bacterium]|nr:hypothetical protein [Deltaproteobacteria bacterium]|tara:strand:+ start:169 stop:399 length:231 start_codon:yes stop_codon:yes gene_type:complete
MIMDFYTTNLFAFVAVNTLFLILNWRRSHRNHQDDVPKKDDLQSSEGALDQLKIKFLPVYLLVNGADWLQVLLSVF